MNRVLGLTKTAFLDAISDTSIRCLMDQDTASVLDAFFGEQLEGSKLRGIASSLLDLESYISDPARRRLLLELVPENKQSELETRLGRKINLDQVENWTAREVGALREFFGLIEERSALPSISPSETLAPAYGLFPHQLVAVRELLPLLEEGDRRAILHLPTGAGKTRTAMHVIATFLRKNDPSIVVWLASGKELLEQAALAFREAWNHLGARELDIGMLQGSSSPNLEKFSDGFLVVSLSKGWSMASNTDPDWTTKIASKIRLVIFDEAHQSIARTYRQITEELTIDYRCALLGLTATPGRTWADIDQDGKLAEFFSYNKVTLQVPADNPITYLIENGYLAKPNFKTLLAEPGLSIAKEDESRISSSLDIPEDLVAQLTMNEKYVAAVLLAVENLLTVGHRRVLVFAASISLSQLLTAIITARNIECYCVTGLTSTLSRESSIRRFKSNTNIPVVLINFGVLTTGFDAPKASAVVIARPTKSLVLYSQMIGRAIRGPRAGGTENCEVVTVVDPRLTGFGDLAEAFLNWEDVWN